MKNVILAIALLLATGCGSTQIKHDPESFAKLQDWYANATPFDLLTSEAKASVQSFCAFQGRDNSECWNEIAAKRSAATQNQQRAAQLNKEGNTITAGTLEWDQMTYGMEAAAKNGKWLDTGAKSGRDRSVRRAFHSANPCPSTGQTSGPCPGYHVDHIVPLSCGGADSVSNMQWLTAKANLRKGGCR